MTSTRSPASLLRLLAHLFWTGDLDARLVPRRLLAHLRIRDLDWLAHLQPRGSCLAAGSPT